MQKKKPKFNPHKKLFTQNALGEYWQSTCFICTADVFSFRVDDIHTLWDDNNYSGRPICIDCYEELKSKIQILNKIDRQIKLKNYLNKKKNKLNLDKWLFKN